MAGRGSKFAFGLDDRQLPLRRRLFLTGTPRVFAGAAGDGSVRSMDEVKRFGPVVYRLSYAEAVSQAIIVPLDLLVYNVSEAYARMCAQAAEVEVAVREERIGRENAELVVAMHAAMRGRNLSKAFSFHATVADVRAFERDARRLLPLLGAGEEPPTVVAVWGAMGAKRLQAALERAARAERSIVSNPRVLGTGVDVPEVELVVMASPRQSHQTKLVTKKL